MQQRKLHIVSFNVPYPHDYGGVIDVYYKIKALHQEGIKVILHCFKYGRKEQEKLNSICDKVYYYQRNMNPMLHLSKLPFIVKSRENKELLFNLQQDHYPILFEGLHTCFYLTHPSLQKRVTIVRTHNIEHDYYNGLAKREKNPIKRIYFKIEAKKLYHYEGILHHATRRIAISKSDQHYFENRYGTTDAVFPFHANNTVNISLNENREKFLLYHGALDVAENIEAALFLIQAFHNKKEIKLTIAGNKPSPCIKKAIKNSPNITLISSPKQSTLDGLVKEAHIHVLPTFQPTGVKLKLIHTLFNGKHIICNAAMLNGTHIHHSCHLAEETHEFIALSQKLLKTPFTKDDIALRKKDIGSTFENRNNAEIIIKALEK